MPAIIPSQNFKKTNKISRCFSEKKRIVTNEYQVAQHQRLNLVLDGCPTEKLDHTHSKKFFLEQWSNCWEKSVPKSDNYSKNGRKLKMINIYCGASVSVTLI